MKIKFYDDDEKKIASFRNRDVSALKKIVRTFFKKME